MLKRGIIRYANYTVCASVFIHFCMQRKNNENIPIIFHVLNTNRLNMILPCRKRCHGSERVIYA